MRDDARKLKQERICAIFKRDPDLQKTYIASMVGCSSDMVRTTLVAAGLIKEPHRKVASGTAARRKTG